MERDADGMLATVAQVLPPNGAVNDAGIKVLHASVSKQQTSRGVPFPEHFLSERHALFAAFGLCETEELASGKVT
jgi:hypothetical protein